MIGRCVLHTSHHIVFSHCHFCSTLILGSVVDHRMVVLLMVVGVTGSPCVSQNTVDKLLKKTNLALVIGTNSWREQFVEAITVSSGMAPHTR